MTHEHSYAETALETYRRAGYDAVEFWCVGNRRSCMSWNSFKIERAIELWGEGTLLIMLARRGRCTSCGRRGVHVQVVRNEHIPFNRNYVPPEWRALYKTSADEQT